MLPIEIRYGSATSDTVPERHERPGSGGSMQLSASLTGAPLSPRGAHAVAASSSAQRPARDSVASPSTRNELRGSGIRDSGSGIDRNITAEGYLKKKGEQNPIWKRRFFYLKDHVLYYYEDQRKQKLLGQINLHDALLIRTSPPSSHLAQALSIWSPNRYFQIDLPLRTYYFYAETLDDVRYWLKYLSDSKAALKRRERNAARALAAPSPSLSPSVPAIVQHPPAAVPSLGTSVPSATPALFSPPRSSLSTSVLHSFPTDDSRRVEATANTKQSNLAGGYAGADDAMSALLSAAAPAATSLPVTIMKPSAMFIDPHVDETPLSNVPIHATTRALMTEEGCEIDMQQIKFMEELGEGCFGKVYHCLLWEKDVAVKVLKDQGLQRVKADLENEIAVLKSLRHPNCVLFIGYSVNPFFYIITEFMSQGSLYDILHNPVIRLTSSQQVKITIEIALAMNYLHQHNPQVLHRDLKTSNILINESWTVKVSDFGLAELRGALQLPQVCGAVQWRAPEVTETFFHAPADVFSFGILCWEVLTRKKPFGDMEPMDVLRAIQDGKRPPLGEMDSGLQADIIQRCWAHDPYNRPTFQQILESLKPLAINEDLNVMQLKSTPDIYQLNDPNSVQRFQRRTQQGFYPSLPPHASHARIWSTMFRHDKAAEGLKIFTEQFYPNFEGLAKGSLIMTNKHGKLKAVFYYDSMEHVKLVDQAVGRLDTAVLESVFNNLKGTVCAPLIRENLEITEFAIPEDGEIRAAQVISSSLLHGEQKGAAFTSFDHFIDNTFASMRPKWQGSLLIGDHSTFAFTIVNLFQRRQDIDEIEVSGVLQQKIETFAPVLASIPVVENFTVHLCRRLAHSRPLSGSHSPLTASAERERSPLTVSAERERSPLSSSSDKDGALQTGGAVLANHTSISSPIPTPNHAATPLPP